MVNSVDPIPTPSVVIPVRTFSPKNDTAVRSWTVATPAITSPLKLDIPCASTFPRKVAMPGSITIDLAEILPSSSRFFALIIWAVTLPNSPSSLWIDRSL